MKKKNVASFFFLSLLFAGLGIYGLNFINYETELISPIAPDNPYRVLGINTNNHLQANISPNKIVNVLLLGLDGRAGDGNPRCDAIHMISFDRGKTRLKITTVPRGIIATNQNMSNYISNFCHYLGVKDTIPLIEKITGIKPDYTVKVGFSQVLGLLRLIGLPANPSLQFLRNRRYGIGDYQRSFNQAQFLKDMLVGHFKHFASLPQSLQYLIYRTVDTDVEFEKVSQLMSEFANSNIIENPEKIELVTLPADDKKRKDLHFDEKIFTENDNWKYSAEFIQYQDNLMIYINNLLGKAQTLLDNNDLRAAQKTIAVPFTQKIWLQLEDSSLRTQYYWELLRIYSFTNPDKNKIFEQIGDFIKQMELDTNFPYLKKAQDLYKLI